MPGRNAPPGVYPGTRAERVAASILSFLAKTRIWNYISTTDENYRFAYPILQPPTNRYIAEMKNTHWLVSSKRLLLGAVFFAGALSSAQAGEGRCLVIHVPQESPQSFKQALNIANNLPKQLGADAARVEIVAQGSGLNLLTEGSPEAERIKSLAVQSEETMGGGTQFSACAATIAGIKKRTGKDPVLLDGVQIVRPGAVARIMDLQEQGCSYIRI
jgi:intracellular sulfur oxidation DsrE/DsrF family protein